MNNVTVFFSSVFLSVGIALCGYFIGDGMKQSQPWHYLSDPSAILKDLHLPDGLNLGVKAMQAGENGATFRIKLDEEVYEVQTTILKGRNNFLGLAELNVKKIELRDF